MKRALLVFLTTADLDFDLFTVLDCFFNVLLLFLFFDMEDFFFPFTVLAFFTFVSLVFVIFFLVDFLTFLVLLLLLLSYPSYPNFLAALAASFILSFSVKIRSYLIKFYIFFIITGIFLTSFKQFS